MVMIAFVYDPVPGMSNMCSSVCIECEMQEKGGA